MDYYSVVMTLSFLGFCIVLVFLVHGIAHNSNNTSFYHRFPFVY